MPSRLNLNARQARFCEEYIVDLNATQAAIRAGYSERTAGQLGFSLLKNLEVAARISALQAKRSKRTEITQDRVLAELAKIGFADIRKAVSWDKESTEFTPSDQLDDETAGAIIGIDSKKRTYTDKDGNSESVTEIKLRLADKRAALVDIGKHLGMFNDRNGNDNAPPEAPPPTEFAADDGSSDDEEPAPPESPAT